MLGQVGPDESVLIRSARAPHPVPGPLRMSDQRLRSVTEKLRPKPEKAGPPRAAGPSQPDRMKRPGPPKDIREPRRRPPPAAESSPGGTQGDQQPGHDLLTSRFHPGGRGVVFAALKQRSHSAPHRREVKVQLFDPGPLRTSSQHAVGVECRMEAGPLSGFHRDATNAFVKRPLLESSLNVVTDPSFVTSDLTASGQTPRLQVTHLDSAAGVLSHHQQSSLNAMATGTVAMATTRHDQRPEQTRDGSIVSTVTLPPAGSHLHPSTNHSEGTTRRANETLREMGRLKTELKMLLRSEDSLKTTTSGPDRHQSQQTQSLSHQGPFQPNQTRHCQSRSQQHFQYTPVQKKPVVLSALEEAGLVLHRVRRQKKVLEENLDALLRAQSGEVLHLQLDALAANRDWREEVRIKKTVDAWINTSTIQEETSSGFAMTSQQRAAGNSAHTGRGRPGNVLRATGSERAGGRGSRGQMPGAEPDSATGESYLTRLYGRAPYEGLRRTLKKSPYLRFSSPVSRLSRKPRPRLVESVTGVKVKSRKTQTSPGRPQDCDIISSIPLTCGDLTESPAVRGSVAMAIPLGRPRTDSPSVAEHRQEVTSPPVAPSAYCVVAADDRASEPQRVEQLEAPPPLNIIENKSEEEEFNEDASPGTEFLSVADVVQKELSFEGEEEVQLDGGPSPPLVLYQGPVFPPQIRSVLHTTDQVSVQDLDLQRDVLENRLVEWVQQQLMSRIISEMYPPSPSDPGQKGPADQSESTEQSAAPDPVAAAGGGGLQLFVDSNMSVNSALIRQLVSEVLTEQVALLLGQSDLLDPEPEPPEPGPRSHKEEELVPLTPAPVPTPQHSSREATPPPSEPTSMLNDESPQPIPAAELVAAPTSSLEPAPSAGSPPAVHGGSPSAVHAGSPPAVHQAPPPLSWENVELPLDEERPEEHLETRSNLLVMSVAEEEPPFFSPVPPPYISPPPSPAVLPHGPDPRPESPLPRGPDPRPESPLPRGPDPRPESPLPRGPDPRPASSSSSSEESCSTVTAETEAALKHISEGELLLCVHQLAATAEDVFSFSSSLQEIQEMDFDPSSEGQVRGCDLWKSKKGARRRDHGEEVRQSGTEQDSSCSPGQIRAATNQSSVAVGDLMAEPIRTLTSELQTDGSLSPLSPPHLDDTPTAAQSGVMREEVHLPFITREEEEEEEEEEVSVAAETNSSTDDVF
ncbi:protein TALPID3 isoform X2 [Pungitius pungitius]|uniref:protein TALPID3 isoform X2 n=1 Tax=Pungitius pungitius TaxID=134920 RepID=UPI002E120965